MGDNWPMQEQLLQVAWYYYVDGLTQEDIAKRINVSRASAGRMLDRCRKEGIVTFTINSDYYDAFDLGRRLREKWGLVEAMVPPFLEQDLEAQSVVNARLGRGAAQYLQSRLKPGDVLAMGWGDTVYQTMQLLNPESLADVTTVSLTGGVGVYVNALRRVRKVREGETLDHIIPTPIMASSAELATALRQENQVQQIIEMSKHAHYAIVGIGAVSGQPTLQQHGSASREELADSAEKGAVGDILGVFYDAFGKPVDLEMHNRRIGIELEDLRGIETVIGVAGGGAKFAAILAALRGGYINVLVTNEEIAKQLLAEETEVEDSL